MPFKVNPKNLAIILVMAVVGFYFTSFLVGKYGSN